MYLLIAKTESMNTFLRMSVITFLMLFVHSSFAQPKLQAQWLVQPYLPLVTGPLYKADAAITKTGDTYVIGSFTNGADFATGDDTFYVAAPKGNAQFLAKYDKSGKVIFAEGMTGNDPGYSRFVSAATDADGNIYITGLYGTGFDFDPGPGVVTLPTAEYYESDLFFAKYNKDGQLLFAKPISSRNNKSYSFTVAVDKQNNICIAGIIYGNNNDFDPGAGTASLSADLYSGNTFFAKYDASGNYLFAKMLVAGPALDVAFDQSNNILLAGLYSDKINDFDPGPATAKITYKKGTDLFFAKYSPAGDYIFAKSVGGAGADYISTILADSKNNITIGGSFSDSADFDPGPKQLVRTTKDASPDLFIETFDSLGNYKWVTTAGGTGSDGCSALASDRSGNIFATGTFSGSDAMFSTKSGNMVLASAGGTDIFYSCYDSLGRGIFVKQIGGAGNETVQNILLQPSGNFTLSGSYLDSLDFDLSPRQNIQHTLLNTAYFATYTNSTGQYISASDIDVYQNFTNKSDARKLIQDKAGNTYVAGTFQGIVDFDPGPGTYYITSSNNLNTSPFNTYGDNFFAKYNKNGKLVFVKTIVASAETQVTGLAIDDNQNVYLAGYYTGSVNLSPGTDTAVFSTLGNNGTYSSFFAEYDSKGNYRYSKHFDLAGNFTGIALDKNRNIYVTANFTGKAAFNPADSTAFTKAFSGGDMAIISYDNSGNFIYVKHIGEKGGFHSVYPYDMKISAGGRIIICGELNGEKTDFDPGAGIYYLSSGKSTNYFTAAYTLSGGFLFAATADTTGTGYSYATELALDGEDILIKGAYSGQLDLDPRPDKTTASNYKNLNPFFMKYSSSGAIRFINANLANETLANTASIGGIATDTLHNIYIGGYFAGKTDFDYGSDTAFLYGGAPYLAKYNDTGAFIYVNDSFAVSYPNSGYSISGMYINRQNQIIIAGSGTGTIDFNPDYGSLLFKSQVSEFFIADYKELPMGNKMPFIIALTNQDKRMNIRH